MIDSWDVNWKRCGNCQFWPLDGWGQSKWDLGEGFTRPPSGIRGVHFSDCRRHSPAIDNLSPEKAAAWPTTNVGHGCGDFEPRERRKPE
jgi:hypothetical protein